MALLSSSCVLVSVTGFQVDLACVVIFLVCIFYTAMVSRTTVELDGKIRPHLPTCPD